MEDKIRVITVLLAWVSLVFFEFVLPRIYPVNAGQLTLSSRELWQHHSRPVRAETISDLALYLVILTLGNVPHLILYYTKSRTGYNVTHVENYLAYFMIWPIQAVWLTVMKYSFFELRPNFLGLCFFNSTTHTSQIPNWVYDDMHSFTVADCTGPTDLITTGVMSFPSGHSCGAFAMITYNFLLIRRVLPDFYCPLVLTMLLIFPTYCAGSRYYDGFHHLHDVVIGSLLGVMISCYVYYCTIRPAVKERPQKINAPSPMERKNTEKRRTSTKPGADVTLAQPGTLFSGGHRLNHGLNDNQEMERMYADWVEDCESQSFKIHNEAYQKWSARTENGKKFVDIDFDIEDPVNFGDKKTNTWVRITDASWGKKGKPIKEAAFIKDGIDAFDISQGRIGNCWFLSSISALAQKRKLIKRVLMPQYNNQPEAREGGIYRFRFYRMGEWMDIIIDDQLPKRYAAKPTDGEFWVPLLEKAYAKFFDGYKNTIGGDPTWALCNLTGGICLEIANDQFNTAAIERMALSEAQGGNAFDLFEFLKRIQNEAVFATSNTENAGEDATQHSVGQMGLVAGHAYAMLKVAHVRFNKASTSEDGERSYSPGDIQRIVQIRNPWASGEWLGNWHDGDVNWDAIDAEDKKKYHSSDDDGCFWMSWEDWTTEFETLDICYMPDEEKGKNHRVIGDFIAGVNAPTGLSQLSKSYLKPELTHQIEVIVGPNCDVSKKGVKTGHTEVYFQFLIDCSGTVYNSHLLPHYLAFNLFTNLEDHDQEYTRKELKQAKHVEPVLPLKKGFQIDYYRHNGYIYHLEPGRRYVLVISAAPKKTMTTPDKEGTEFMLRAIGDDLQIQHQTDI